MIRLAREGIPLPGEVYSHWTDLTELGHESGFDRIHATPACGRDLRARRRAAEAETDATPAGLRRDAGAHRPRGRLIVRLAAEAIETGRALGFDLESVFGAAPVQARITTMVHDIARDALAPQVANLDRLLAGASA